MHQRILITSLPFYFQTVDDHDEFYVNETAYLT